MCGIVGYAGPKRAVDVLLDGLCRLEYRGYDSAGVALLDECGTLEVIRRIGEGKGPVNEKLSALEELAETCRVEDLPQTTGIGHTRWATHGRPSVLNAHPHIDCHGDIAVVHNGIIENYDELRSQLMDRGHVFVSDTDTEVIAHLLEEYYQGSLLAAMRCAVAKLRGAWAIAAVAVDEPGTIVVTRRDSPIVVGSTGDASLVASDICALIERTRDVVFIEDDQFAVLHDNGDIDYHDAQGNRVALEPTHVDWDIDAAERGGYPDFMLKEIHEQPRIVRDALSGRLRDGKIVLDGLSLTNKDLAEIDRVSIIACGTSYHAGLVARNLIEQWARIPVSVEVASEFRYRDPIITPSTLMVAITQSGETADTLAAMRLAREHGARVFAITNIVGSRAARESDGVIYIKAGYEICVAATKTFIAQLVSVSCLALFLAQRRGYLSDAEVCDYYSQLEDTASQIEEILADTTSIKTAALACADAQSMMFIGRGMGATTCYEGALKLKEISYLHAEAYAAGEIKHGPIALIDDTVPVLAIATSSPTYEKVIANIEELRSRNATIVAVATQGDTQIARHADYVIYIPPIADCFSVITASVPLQLFARYIAKVRGCDVDKPRNLAKSVTVE